MSNSFRLRLFFYKAQSRPYSSEIHVIHKYSTHHTHRLQFFFLISEYYIVFSPENLKGGFLFTAPVVIRSDTSVIIHTLNLLQPALHTAQNLLCVYRWYFLQQMLIMVPKHKWCSQRSSESLTTSPAPLCIQRCNMVFV